MATDERPELTPEQQESLKRGLEQSARGETIYLGDFSKMERDEKLERLAVLSKRFLDDTVMVHMWIAMGRADELEGSAVQKRRVADAEEMRKLHEELGITKESL